MRAVHARFTMKRCPERFNIDHYGKTLVFFFQTKIHSCRPWYIPPISVLLRYIFQNMLLRPEKYTLANQRRVKIDSRH